MTLESWRKGNSRCVSALAVIPLGILLSLGLQPFVSEAAAQQAAATGEPLSVRTPTLPKAFLRQPYRFRITAQGGITPLRWRLLQGSLPAGLILTRDGLLTGTPSAVGEFTFLAAVNDSGKPAYEIRQEFHLKVVAPLLVQWLRYPKVTGQRVEGAIKVSNQTERDSDLTVVVLAVADNGRATAIGYQRLTLKKNTLEFEIPFGENLPQGTYQVNVDAVSEVAASNNIFRARLVANNISVQQGP